MLADAGKSGVRILAYFIFEVKMRRHKDCENSFWYKDDDVGWVRLCYIPVAGPKGYGDCSCDANKCRDYKRKWWKFWRGKTRTAEEIELDEINNRIDKKVKAWRKGVR